MKKLSSEIKRLKGSVKLPYDFDNKKELPKVLWEKYIIGNKSLKTKNRKDKGNL